MPDGLLIRKPHELIDSLFVETPPAKQALEAIEILRKYGIRNGWCECLLIAGPSRAGKSAVVEYYERLFPVTMDGRQLIRPVVRVKLEDVTRTHSLVSATLRAMGDPRPDHGSPTDRSARLIHLLRMQRTELVIYDEFQHLIDSDTDKIAYKAADTVKSILEAGVSRVVLCGVTHAERVLHTNTQLIGRARAPVYMTPTDWRDKEQRLAFRVFLNELEKKLGLPSPSGLSELGTAHKIHHFARGLYGHAHNLIREALLNRHLDGDRAPCITEDLLARAADGLLLREPTRRLNAFRQTPPQEYEPAPMFESLKEPPRSKRQKGDEDVELF